MRAVPVALSGERRLAANRVRQATCFAEIQLRRSGMLIAVGAKPGSSFVGAAHHMSLRRSFSRFFNVFAINVSPLRGLLFVRTNLLPATTGWQRVFFGTKTPFEK